ncbi:MAG: hypothetical protein EP329_26980 [Deltaproteobacteria bacterium]|nr:MAG: hypothetical protein EP329_26980 [Deltaproteobacteria bacterium]
MIALPGDAPGFRLKGAVAVEATVVRDGQTVVADTRIEDLGALADGDRMRLRVRSAAGRPGRVEGLDGGDWVRVWEGAIPEDGWLPFGLTASAGSETALRVAVCEPERPIPADVFAAAAAPEGCVLRTWILDVR